MPDFQQQLNDIRQALLEEIRALNATPKQAVLINGYKITAAGQRTIYRFEFPDTFYFQPSVTIRCSIGTTTVFFFEACVVDVRSQFLYVSVPFDLGETISEMKCEWHPEKTMERLHDKYAIFSGTPIVEKLLERNFSDNSRPQPQREPIFPSTFTETQLAALKDSLSRTVSFVIGERGHGKTGVAASLILSTIREGKRILYLSSSANSLHDCMEEVIRFNSVVAEEQIALFGYGLDLLSPLGIPVLEHRTVITAEDQKKLQQLFLAVGEEYEYHRIRELQKLYTVKLKQVEEATAEYNEVKRETDRLQNASLMERMKQRIGKAEIEYQQKIQEHKAALVERLETQAAAIQKEQYKRESLLSVPVKQRTEVLKYASIKIDPLDDYTLVETIKSKKCFATTLHHALALDPQVISNFDAVCIDDGQIYSAAEFLWMASLAKEQCFIIADVTEQPPQSVSQSVPARQWLQKNYFTYYQQEDSDYYRFMINLLPLGVVSELIMPDVPRTLFEESLTAVLDGTPMRKNFSEKIYFFNTQDEHSISPQYIGKKKILPYNETHSRRVIDCIKHALLQGDTTQEDILVVTPQSGQTIYLREQLKAHLFFHIEVAPLGAIRLCRKRVVIFDTTIAGLDFTLRQLDDRKFGLIRLADTFNTLLSTVKEELYIIADLSHFQLRYKDRFITKLLNTMNGLSQNVGAVLGNVRLFDDLSDEISELVISGSKTYKQSEEYREKIKHGAVSASQNSEKDQRRLTLEIRTAVLDILAKRENINTIAQYFATPPLYIVNNETLKFRNELPFLECKNEDDFKKVMDMWNLLIYETSNILRDHPLSAKAKVDSKLTQEFQQLYSFYHSELEMVVEEGKHKLATSIQKIFNDVIGKKPVTAADWMNAYLVFLNRMEKYLDTIINQIRL
ncbi:MAG: hypothetical protein H3C35_11710 [Bacteroidetes bacterium]|nr:hypothetical protein [Bacteroidota bacterium]